mgnify:CR=1 FL=1
MYYLWVESDIQITKSCELTYGVLRNIIAVALTQQDVEHVAQLAQLELTNEEKARFQQQLSAILKYAERLNQINVSSIPPTETVLPLHNIMREDESSPSPARQSLLKNAPDTDKGCFRVPPVLE